MAEKQKNQQIILVTVLLSIVALIIIIAMATGKSNENSSSSDKPKKATKQTDEIQKNKTSSRNQKKADKNEKDSHANSNNPSNKKPSEGQSGSPGSTASESEVEKLLKFWRSVEGNATEKRRAGVQRMEDFFGKNPTEETVAIFKEFLTSYDSNEEMKDFIDTVLPVYAIKTDPIAKNGGFFKQRLQGKLVYVETFGDYAPYAIFKLMNDAVISNNNLSPGWNTLVGSVFEKKVMAYMKKSGCFTNNAFSYVLKDKDAFDKARNTFLQEKEKEQNNDNTSSADEGSDALAINDIG